MSACPDLICGSIGSNVKEIHWMEKSGHLVLLEDELDQVVKITEGFIERVMALAN
jgi:esterase/lipase